MANRIASSRGLWTALLWRLQPLPWRTVESFMQLFTPPLARREGNGLRRERGRGHPRFRCGRYVSLVAILVAASLVAPAAVQAAESILYDPVQRTLIVIGTDVADSVEIVPLDHTRILVSMASSGIIQAAEYEVEEVAGIAVLGGARSAPGGRMGATPSWEEALTISSRVAPGTISCVAALAMTFSMVARATTS
jgi:hypothetical protein